MQLRLFESGIIDEVYVSQCSLEISKSGGARYSFSLSCDSNISFDLWTTKIGHVDFNVQDIVRPIWVDIQTENDHLLHLKAENCSFHMEHCDRGLYYMELSKEGDSIKVLISTKGYIKTRLLAVNESSS